MNFLPPTEMKRTQLLHELFIDAILGTGNQYLCSTLSSWFKNIHYFSKSKKKMTNLVKEKEHERKKKNWGRGGCKHVFILTKFGRWEKISDKKSLKNCIYLINKLIQNILCSWDSENRPNHLPKPNEKECNLYSQSHSTSFVFQRLSFFDTQITDILLFYSSSERPDTMYPTQILAIHNIPVSSNSSETWG